MTTYCQNDNMLSLFLTTCCHFDNKLSKKSHFLSNFSAAELMQYRSPVGFGPSGKTWPRCAPQRAQVASIRLIPWLISSCVSIAAESTGSQKLGHPEPDSNFLSEANNSASQATQWYIPSS